MLIKLNSEQKLTKNPPKTPDSSSGQRANTTNTLNNEAAKKNEKNSEKNWL